MRTQLCWIGQPVGGFGRRTLEPPKWIEGQSIRKLSYTILVLVLHWKFLFREQILTVAKHFFWILKLTQNLLHMLQLLAFICPTSFSAWLTTIVSPVSALFYIKISESQPACEDCTLPLPAKEMEWRWTFWRVFKTRVFKEGFSPGEFFQSNKCFCFSNFHSTQSRHYRVSFAFLASKVTIAVTKLPTSQLPIGWHMMGTHQWFNDGCFI